MTFQPGPLRGRVRVAGDKSISHRALMLGALAPGTSRIDGLNRGADVAATRDALIALGARISDGGTLTVHDAPLRDPAETIDARNSGTTARLLLGVCAGHAVTARFDGDASLRRRPMERVARPLRALGARIDTTAGALPATVAGIAEPRAGTYALEVPSAQVKSAILLASLRARGAVRIEGDLDTRDHTERMLRRFGRTVHSEAGTIVLEPGTLRAADVRVPGDLSAAAFFIVAAATTPGSALTIQDVGINPTRTGILDALGAMGARIALRAVREQDGEPVADIDVEYGPLEAIELDGAAVVRTIDELPVLAIAAAHARGTTRIREARELRAKESDRIATVAATLRACGIAVDERDDGFDVRGGAPVAPGIPLAAFGDHRIAMSIAVLAAACGPIAVDDGDCFEVSFPEFAARWSAAQTASAGC
jgi:3-phosphoshikimate 1-carboxyvinyltransferase